MTFLPEYIDEFIRSSQDWKVFVPAFLVLVVSLFTVQTFQSWYRLRHFKGPFLASISKLWMIRAVASDDAHWRYAKANSRYGSLARIGPNHLVTSDHELWRRIIAVRGPYKRADWYVGMRLDPSKENVESERDEKKHGILRAKMMAGYSGKDIDNMESSIDYNVEALVKLVEKYVTTGSKFKPMDFGRKAQYFTLDTITNLVYGKAFGYLETDSDLFDYIKTVEETLPAAFMVTVLPWMNWLLQTKVMQAVLPSDKDPLGFGKIVGMTKEFVGQRFSSQAKGKDTDMLASFIRHGLTKSELESETLLAVIAGSDTTAGAVRMIFLYLISNPRVSEKFRNEFTRASISSPITDAEARSLPYLQAIIKEGLRIWPPVTGLMSKEVPPTGDTFNGLFIPGGASIGYCAFGIFRDKKIWGEDADCFRPERWIEGDEEYIREMERVLELVFGQGKWQCLGKNVAMMELNKVFVELFRRFDFTAVDPLKPIRNMSCMGVFAISEFWVTVTRRNEA